MSHSKFTSIALSLLIISLNVSASDEIFEMLKSIALGCAEEHGYEDWNPGRFEEYECRFACRIDPHLY